ncbi:unnamed protein product [Penicillium pancosmium]
MGSIGVEVFHDGETIREPVGVEEKRLNLPEIPSKETLDHAAMMGAHANGNSIHGNVRDDSANTEPIAIVGMAMRLPGNVRSGDDFWDLLCSKKDVGREIPEDRFNIDAFYSSSQRRGIKTKRGFFLDQNLADTDPSAFGMSKAEAMQLDPQQKLLLEVVFEAFENAGATDLHGKDIGCFVGTFGEDHLELSLRDPLSIDRYHVFGSEDFALSNRISHEYDLRGPSVTIRTACSASMTSLHEACNSVSSGESSAAIVAGSNMIMAPTMTESMSTNMVLSPDGECRTFDADANGYARSEAVNAVYIKRLDDAIRDGDPVRAVIRSTMANNNGKTKKLAVPSATAQERLIRRAYQRAGIVDPSRTGLFECHGTGTQAGDVAEAEAIARVFGTEGVHMGAVKSNIGHSEGASGLTSIIKSVLCLEHKAIAPNMRFQTPNPRIPWKEANLQVAEVLTPWPESREARVSVNSFGIGGSNAHVILESTSLHRTGPNVNAEAPKSGSPKLLALSAMNTNSLQSRIRLLQDYLENREVNTQDLAYTLGTRRQHLRHRAFATVQGAGIDSNALKYQVSHAPSAPVEYLTFVFPGQGSQWPGMGKELFASFDVFRESIRHLDEVLKDLIPSPIWSIEEKITAIGDPSCFSMAEFAQPLCAAVQIGLVDLLSSWGVKPKAVIGHSSGEIAAAYAASAITQDAAILIAYYRGQATKTYQRPGKMVAIGLSKDSVQQYLEPGVCVACENSPQNVVISGDPDAITRTVDLIKNEHPDTFTGHLNVETAYHSHHMEEVAPELENRLQSRFHFSAPKIPMYSTVLGRALTEEDQLNARYWKQNLESPVLFSTAVSEALQVMSHHVSCFVEVGPNCALLSPIKQVVRSQSLKSQPRYVHTLQKDQNQAINILEAAGQLFLNGVPISFHIINGTGNCLTDLPPYPWDYSAKQWKESRISKEWRLRKFPHHELLGSRAMGSNDLEPSWRNILSLDNSRWLCDHKFSDAIVFPSAGYVAAVAEAVRQLSGKTAYSFRDIFIRNALFLDEDHDVEVMTVLRPVRLTDILDSEWFEFSVSSYNEKGWIKHCTGQVMGVERSVSPPTKCEVYHRQVNSPSHYEALKKCGLDYGPHFQGLENVTADPNFLRATANLTSETAIDELETYAIHPTIIDKALQLISVALSRGLARAVDRVAIPVSFDRIYLASTSLHETFATALCTSTTDNSFAGEAFAHSNNESILEIQGVKAFVMDTDSALSDPSHAVCSARMDWKSDIEFLPVSTLLPPVSSYLPEGFQMMERLNTLHLIKMWPLIENITPTEPHLTKYKQWVENQIRAFDAGEHKFLSANEAKEFTTSSLDRVSSLIEENETSVIITAVPSHTFLARFVHKVADSVPGIFRGQQAALDVLMEDSGLENYYNLAAQNTDFGDFLSLLGHSRPTMRVLEIGAGTGGLTMTALEGLRASTGGMMYSEYVFTDISPGFFPPAKKRFHGFPGITFKTLDITKDPLEQGLGGFDLVVAANVLHATPSLHQALLNTQKLLKPGGFLFLQELCPEVSMTDLIMGLLPGWWAGHDDNRPDKPYVLPERWNEELLAAGFTGVESLSYDNKKPYHQNANMISRSPGAFIPKCEVLLLYNGVKDVSACMIEKAFLDEGFRVTWHTFGEPLAANQNIVSLLDLGDTPFLADISEQSFTLLRNMLSESSLNSVLWITREAQLRNDDPRRGLILGLARTIRLELSLPFATCEIQILDSYITKSLVQLEQRMQLAQAQDLEIDYEYAIRGQDVSIGRYYPEDITTVSVADTECSRSKRLRIGTCGLMDTLEWVQEDISAPGEGEVQVDIKYIGLNFKDIMNAMGFVGQKDDIGYEATGIIKSVGPGLHHQDFKLGDPVCVLGSSFLRTSVVAKSTRCYKLPIGISLEDAATIPCVYATVVYSLLTLGCLEEGQSVLIHSACGGVGLAAIQICHMVGAEVFATVGSELKASFLVEKHNIPRQNIFNSRDAGFKEGILQRTGGKGVDLVLNSLSGELLHASWEVVAEFGKMIDIGKRDMMGHGMLRMSTFLANRSFFGVDLDRLGINQPLEFIRILKQVMSYIEEKKVQAIHPRTIFDAADAQAAFKHMQTGQHMGKIIIKIPDDISQLSVSGYESSLSLSPDVSYLIVGGLGGLGRAISRWMIEQGAKSLVFLSRSVELSPIRKSFIEELQIMGCAIHTVAGSVAIVEDVQKAIDVCPKPLAGIIQLAMSLRDHTFATMTHEAWHDSLAPKVTGTWNLYQATREKNLDFCVTFGSIISATGNVGQSNYAAANCFLESFTSYARATGYPAAVIQLGAMGDIGFVSESPELQKRLRDLLLQPLRERDLIQSLDVAIRQARLVGTVAEQQNMGSLTIGLQAILDRVQVTAHQSDRRFALYGRSGMGSDREEASDQGRINQFLSEVERDPSILDRQSSLDLLIEEVARLIRTEEDEDESLQAAAEITIDSLMTIEIRNWLRKKIGVDVPSLQITKSRNVGGLALLVIKVLKEKYSEDGTTEK